MASDTLDPPVQIGAPLVPPTVLGEPPRRGFRRAAAVLSPPVAALAALAVHELLDARRTPPMTWLDGLPHWRHPYPLLLVAGLAASLLAAMLQKVWRPLRPWVVHYAPLFAGLVIVLAFWEFTTVKMAWLPLPFFPDPDEVLGAMIDDAGLLLTSTRHSLVLLLSGYFVGVIAGVITGVLIGWFPNVRYWGMPVMKVIGPIPATALVPLVMMLSTQSYLCGVALIGFAVWFPVTMLTASGMANVRLSYLDVARTLGAGRLYLIFHVAIPAALPNIFVGLFMGLGASFLTLIVAETLGVKAGLGWYLQWQKGYAEYAKVYASLVIMAVFFSTLMTLLFKARDRVLKWQKGVIRW